MKNIMEEMLQCKTWAVIGASDKKDRYGYKIFKKLKNHSYKVYPVNPGYSEVAGEKCYKTIKDLPEMPECVSMVVNINIALNVIVSIKEAGVKYVWFQPGSYNDEVVNKAQELGLNIVYDECVLVELRKRENK